MFVAKLILGTSYFFVNLLFFLDYGTLKRRRSCSLPLSAVLLWYNRAGQERMIKENIAKYITKIKQNQFLFEELVKRDFKKRYARTALGMAWSIFNPLLQLLIMRLVFTHFFGRGIDHYTTYLFCGMIVFNYFNESTKEGMTSLVDNAAIFTKINVPKYLFLFAKNIQSFINFLLILLVFFFFCILDRIAFTWRFILLLYPITLMVFFNIGTGLVLSAAYVFFRDMQYFWGLFLTLLNYVSAVFYQIDTFPDRIQKLFYINPVYLYIRYFRKIVLAAEIPSPGFHLLMLAESVIMFFGGILIYRKYNLKFLYYL